jgi:hypothetical protein
MTEPEMMLECIKLAVALALASQDKSTGTIATVSTALYTHANSAGKTSPPKTLSLKPRQ